MSEAYAGVLGAYPYAIRVSDSWLFRVYAIVGGVLAGLLVVFFTFALVVTVAATSGLGDGTLTFVRSVFILVGFLVVAPLIAPVLLVARRHRRTGNDSRYDRGLSIAGIIYGITLYLGVVASMPARFELDGDPITRPEPTGLTGPLVASLYAIPEWLAWLLPLIGATIIYLGHRHLK